MLNAIYDMPMEYFNNDTSKLKGWNIHKELDQMVMSLLKYNRGMNLSAILCLQTQEEEMVVYALKVVPQ